MEKSIDSFVEYLKEEFQLEDQDLRTYSPLTLAYIGDSIFDLVIRTLLVKHSTNIKFPKIYIRQLVLLH